MTRGRLLGPATAPTFRAARRRGGDSHMNCPKGGYQQAERDDCIKCGVVFAKYAALHKKTDKTTSPKRAVEPKTRTTTPPSERPRPAASEPKGRAASAPQPEVVPQPDISGLANQVHELGQRFNAFEFDRAERTRLRGEMRVFDQKLDDRFKELSARLASLEVRLSDLVTSAALAPPAPVEPP